jgi:hypothetical protein
MIGGLAGLVLGLLVYGVLLSVASRIENNPQVKDRQRVARILRTVGVATLLIDIAVGYYFGPILLEG